MSTLAIWLYIGIPYVIGAVAFAPLFGRSLVKLRDRGEITGGQDFDLLMTFAIIFWPIALVITCTTILIYKYHAKVVWYLFGTQYRRDA